MGHIAGGQLHIFVPARRIIRLSRLSCQRVQQLPGLHIDDPVLCALHPTCTVSSTWDMTVRFMYCATSSRGHHFCWARPKRQVVGAEAQLLLHSHFLSHLSVASQSCILLDQQGIFIFASCFTGQDQLGLSGVGAGRLWEAGQHLSGRGGAHAVRRRAPQSWAGVLSWGRCRTRPASTWCLVAAGACLHTI